MSDILFGNIKHEQSSIVGQGSERNTIRNQNLEVRDIKLDFGVQYTHPISKTENVTFGLALFSRKNRLKCDLY